MCCTTVKSAYAIFIVPLKDKKVKVSDTTMIIKVVQPVPKISFLN